MVRRARTIPTKTDRIRIQPAQLVIYQAYNYMLGGKIVDSYQVEKTGQS